MLPCLGHWKLIQVRTCKRKSSFRAHGNRGLVIFYTVSCTLSNVSSRRPPVSCRAALTEEVKEGKTGWENKKEVEWSQVGLEKSQGCLSGAQLLVLNGPSPSWHVRPLQHGKTLHIGQAIPSKTWQPVMQIFIMLPTPQSTAFSIILTRKSH